MDSESVTSSSAGSDLVTRLSLDNWRPRSPWTAPSTHLQEWERHLPVLSTRSGTFSVLSNGADEALETETMSYRDVASREAAARRRLYAAQRQLRRASSHKAVEEHRERMRARARAVRDDLEQKLRRPTELLELLEPAYEHEVIELAQLFNRQMKFFETEPSWFKLFVWMDCDRSGSITYDELSRMVREQLKLSKRRLPEESLGRLWKALDTDDSGLVDAGEFGRFMRKGKEYDPATQIRHAVEKRRNDALQRKREVFLEDQALRMRRRASETAVRAERFEREAARMEQELMRGKAGKNFRYHRVPSHAVAFWGGDGHGCFPSILSGGRPVQSEIDIRRQLKI